MTEFAPNHRRSWKNEQRKGRREGRGDGERVDETVGVEILKVSLKCSATTEWNDSWHRTVNMHG